MDEDDAGVEVSGVWNGTATLVYVLNCWVDRPVWLVQERQTDRVDGITAYFHGVVVVVVPEASLTRKTQQTKQGHGDIAALRCRPGTWRSRAI